MSYTEQKGGRAMSCTVQKRGRAMSYTEQKGGRAMSYTVQKRGQVMSYLYRREVPQHNFYTFPTTGAGAVHFVKLKDGLSNMDIKEDTIQAIKVLDSGIFMVCSSR
jgi:hypothetical protein